MSAARFPARYRRLLTTFSPMWRRLYGEVTLATLLELHAARGRSRPSFAEGVSFAVAGLASRFPGGVPAQVPSRSERVPRIADSAEAPAEIPLLNPGFFLLAGLGASTPVAAFPSTTITLSLSELLRRRRAAAVRLPVEALLLGTTVALLLWGPPTVLLLVTGALLVATAAAVFDVALFVRLGQRILTHP